MQGDSSQIQTNTQIWRFPLFLFLLQLILMSLFLLIACLAPLGLLLCLVFHIHIGRGANWDRSHSFWGSVAFSILGILLISLLLWWWPHILNQLALFWMATILLAPLCELSFQGLLFSTRLLTTYWLSPISSSSTQQPPDQIDGTIVMGTALQGDLWTWVNGSWLTYPQHILNLHAAVIGRSGAGKSETLLRIAYLAAKVYKMKVLFVDAKGDWETAARFVSHMQEAGIQQVGVFPTAPHNGWLGEPHDLLNRLMESQHFSESYYEGVAMNMLHLAINAPGGMPKSSQQLLDRLNPNELKKIYKEQPEYLELQALRSEVAWGVFHRYAAFFRAVRGKLDGETGFGSWDAAYYLLDGIRLRDEASRLGQYLISDFEQYMAIRKPGTRKRRVLIIIDEFSAISSKADAAGLFERIRSLGGSVIVSSQSYAGLGEFADRLLATSATVILHASILPKVFSEIAGQQMAPDISYQIPDEEENSSSSEREGIEGGRNLRYLHTYRIPPTEIQQLGIGEAFLIYGGRAHRAKIAMLPHNSKNILTLESKLYEDYLATHRHSPSPNTQSQQEEPPNDPLIHSLDDLSQKGQPVADSSTP